MIKILNLMLKQLNHFTCNNNHQHTANMFGTQDKGAEKLQSSDRQITPKVKLKTRQDQNTLFGGLQLHRG